jgi:hypothetical protein
MVASTAGTGGGITKGEYFEQIKCIVKKIKAGR